MNNINQVSGISPNQLNQSTAKPNQSTTGFADILKNTIEEVNQSQVQADVQAAKVATGEVRDLHQAAIAINKAERDLSFMLEVRNKAISAYKELSRTQI